MQYYIQTLRREKLELDHIPTEVVAEKGRLILRAPGFDDMGDRLTKAAATFFEFGVNLKNKAATKQDAEAETPLALFRETASGLLRLCHNEITIRFVGDVAIEKCHAILKDRGLTIRATNDFVPQQFYVVDATKQHQGVGLIDIANSLMELDEVLFAKPNFVSENRRSSIPIEQWHLENLGTVAGQVVGEDINAPAAWNQTRGKKKIVVAVLDDGVDVAHPNLSKRIKKNPDPSQPLDQFGRDYYLPNSDPGHFDPRPKVFQSPFDELEYNDIHGTACAGLVAAQGKNAGALGVAPKCRILPVKIFHANNFASDSRVADAIRYSSLFADILSCSWESATSCDIEAAIEIDAGAARGGKGAAVFCAAGRGVTGPIVFPANMDATICVGGSTDEALFDITASRGPEMWVVAPTSGGQLSIYTTDVAIPNRGFNLGDPNAGGIDGLHTNRFGGTSASTAIAAGVAALMLSLNKQLTRDEIREILRQTADPIRGNDYDPQTGHSEIYGYGRVDAAAALNAVP